MQLCRVRQFYIGKRNLHPYLGEGHSTNQLQEMLQKCEARNQTWNFAAHRNI